MSANQKRKLFCVWDNTDDSVIAIDQTSDTCAALMGVTRATFFSLKSRMSEKPDVQRRWTIINSNDIDKMEE